MTSPSFALEIRMLGAFSMRVGEGPIRVVPEGVVGRLLALLCLYEGGVEREILGQWLWPDELDGGRRLRRFSTTLGRLRALLDDPAVVEVSETRIRLAAKWVDVDLWQVRRLMRRAETERGEAKAGALAQALRAASGTLLPGIATPWAIQEREALQSQWVDTAVRCAKLELDLRQEETGFARLIEACAWDPLNDDTLATYLEACLRFGRIGEGLQAFEGAKGETRRLGLEPSPETERLARALRSMTPSLPDAPLSHAPSLTPAARNLAGSLAVFSEPWTLQTASERSGLEIDELVELLEELIESGHVERLPSPGPSTFRVRPNLSEPHAPI